LLKRLSRGDRVWEAHRSHFYQRARDNGFSVMAVDARVFALNLALVALAGLALLWPALEIQAAALAIGCALVGWQLKLFATPRKPALSN
jgi:hypothetical protein